MSSTSFFFRRAALLTIASLAALVAGNCYAVISFELPDVQVPPATSGPTTGTFNVLVRAAAGDLPKQIGSFNVDFSVANTLVTLGTASIPTTNPLLSDPGTAQNPFFIDFSPTAQRKRVGHDVPVDQPLGDGKALITVPFSVPAGLTGTFPLSFGTSQFNTLVDSGANPLALNLADVGQIIVAAVTVGVPGDYNSNGTVDAADYVLWRNGGPLQNDPTPGVQADDYNFWRARFGRTSGSGSGAGALVSGAVPEPSSLVLILIVSLFPAFARGQRRHCGGA